MSAFNSEPMRAPTVAEMAEKSGAHLPPVVSAAPSPVGTPAPTQVVCECSHDAGSHNAGTFNCLATTEGTHATRCACRKFVPSAPDQVKACTCVSTPIFTKGGLCERCGGDPLHPSSPVAIAAASLHTDTP